MTQKIIKIGKSAGVTIPKKELERLGLKPGDQVTVEYDKERDGYFVAPFKRNEGETEVDAELLEWTDRFIEDYRPALEELADK